ncbi:hypothetical protein ACIOG7_03005 [Streptomyces sp. NPDC087894]|uniref:hypothetical protein n=1 Tax=Streptomyces sp. NPDC087894 TaxID=3365816 RepID=UPI0038223270
MLSAGEEVDEAGGGVVAEADVDDLGGVPVEQLPEHDDRDQFLTGVDLFVTGIVTARA